MAAQAGYRSVAPDGTEIVISEGQMRISMPTMGMLRGYDPANDRFWMANTKTRTYWQGTVDEYCQIVKRTQDAMMEQHMARIPPAQRRIMEEHMKGSAPAPAASAPAVKVSIERTDERTTIAGYAVRKVRVLANGQLYEELWLASDPSLVRALDHAKVKQMDRAVRDCVGGEGQARREREMANMPDAYLRSVDPTGQLRKQRLARAVESSPEYASVLREGMALPAQLNALEERDIASAEVAPPAGYRAVAPDEVMGAPAPR
ncbi:MAG TPA: hypothetical protein VM183_13440 [Burkholderiales bacterium]|nr:hypothetical protein [Burkholderiales bacterium]